MTRTARVYDYFRARPGVWLDGQALAEPGGRYAWRTRVSECRRAYGMVIDNRQRSVQTPRGPITVSEYRYRPHSLLDFCEENHDDPSVD